MNSKNEVSEKINVLIEKNMDSYKGFRKAAETTKNIHLRDYLIEEATDRKEFADELLSPASVTNSSVLSDEISPDLINGMVPP